MVVNEALFPVQGSGGGASGLWAEAGSTSLGVAGASISVSVATLKRYWMVEADLDFAASNFPQIIFNGSTALDYNFERVTDGGAKTTTINDDSIILAGAARTGSGYIVIWGQNVAAREKQINYTCYTTNAGDTTGNTITTGGGKWVNTADLITTIAITGSADFDIGSKVVVSHHD